MQWLWHQGKAPRLHLYRLFTVLTRCPLKLWRISRAAFLLSPIFCVTSRHCQANYFLYKNVGANRKSDIEWCCFSFVYYKQWRLLANSCYSQHNKLQFFISIILTIILCQWSCKKILAWDKICMHFSAAWKIINLWDTSKFFWINSHKSLTLRSSFSQLSLWIWLSWNFIATCSFTSSCTHSFKANLC